MKNKRYFVFILILLTFLHIIIFLYIENIKRFSKKFILNYFIENKNISLRIEHANFNILQNELEKSKMETEFNDIYDESEIGTPYMKYFFDVMKVKPAKKFEKSFEVVQTSRVKDFKNPSNLRARNITNSKEPPSDKKRMKTDVKELEEFVENQVETKERRKSYCRKTKMNTSAFGKVYIEKNHKLAFCPIFKSASSSWFFNLLKLNGFESKPKSIVAAVDFFLTKVTGRTSKMATKDTVNFIVVRHPMNRLVSAFRDKLENASKPYYFRRFGARMTRKYRYINSFDAYKIANETQNSLKTQIKFNYTKNNNKFLNSELGPTFKEFVQYITDIGNVQDEHWKPFYIQCSLCFIEYDFVLKFENLNEDSSNFIHYMNFSSELNGTWLNPTENGSTDDIIVCKYISQIDPRLYYRVVKKYYHDFGLFDYSSDKFRHCLPKF